MAKEFENGDYETSGKNVLQGLYNGLNNGTLGQNLINKAAGIAKSIAKQFNIEWDEHSPSKLMKKMAEYFLQPISTVFSKKQRGLTTDAKNLAKNISQGFDNAFEINPSVANSKMKEASMRKENEAKNNIQRVDNNSQYPENFIIDIDYDKMANAITKSLTNCKFTLDEDGFAKIVKDELYKVV